MSYGSFCDPDDAGIFSDGCNYGLRCKLNPNGVYGRCVSKRQWYKQPGELCMRGILWGDNCAKGSKCQKDRFGYGDTYRCQQYRGGKRTRKHKTHRRNRTRRS